jgi:hypothetical protein
MSRYAKRADDNQAAIFEAWRKIGLTYHNTSAAGGGFPDAIVCGPQSIDVRLVEIKDGHKVPSARKLTVAERAFARRFPVWVVGCVHCAVGLATGHRVKLCCGVDGAKLATTYDAEARP